MRSRQLWVGIIILFLTLISGLVLVHATLKWFNTLNGTVAAACVTAIIGLVGLWYSQWQSKSRDIAESHRSSKIDVYNPFFDIVERFQRSQDKVDAEVIIDEAVKKEFTKLNRGLVLWASPEVIQAWLKFKITAASDGNVLVAIDQMYKAIRKDLGNSNFGLSPGDLIRLGLKDPNEWKP